MGAVVDGSLHFIDASLAYRLLLGVPARQRLLLLVQRLPDTRHRPPHRAAPAVALPHRCHRRDIHRLSHRTRSVTFPPRSIIRYFT